MLAAHRTLQKSTKEQTVCREYVSKRIKDDSYRQAFCHPLGFWWQTLWWNMLSGTNIHGIEVAIREQGEARDLTF